MKHIDKTGQRSLQGKAIVDNWILNNQSVINQLATQGNTAGELWGKFDRKKEILAYLLEEQGGLCCYCGRELTQKAHYIVIEHFKLKSVKTNNQYPNMFDYDNLLLSCHGNSYAFYEVKNGDTWASIASTECTFKDNSIDGLKKMNPDIDVENNEPKAGETLIVGFIRKAVNHHCDNFRADKPLRINPTQLPNCIDRFVYTVRERHNEGGVKPHSNDVNAEAEEAIKNLNLNAAVLLRERAKIVEDAAILFDDISIAIEENQATERQEIIDIANSYLSVIKGFYVVYRAYFKDDFPELFEL